MHETHGVVTVIILAEDVESLVAPGKDGFFMKREPVKPDLINSMIVKTAKKNERDRRERIDDKTINSAILRVGDNSRQADSQNSQSQRRSMFY